jgi:predicted Zn-dependent peptidase
VSRASRLTTALFAAALASACVRHATPAVTQAPAADTVDVTKPPALGDPKPLTLPAVVTRELPNGLRLYVVELHELPLADVVLAVRTGGEGEPADRAGLATLTAQLLKEGTPTRTSLQIADQEAFLGVTVSAGSGWDVSTVSLHTPTAQLDSSLALFADVALHPIFPAAELERLRSERLTSLLQVKDQPPAIADRVYASVLFGEEHPYGRPLSGTETSVAAITRGDVQRFYSSYFRPNNAALIVVGDVKPDDIERRVRALLGGWTRDSVPAVSFATPPRAGKTTIYLVDKPGAPQSSVRIGAVGVPRSTEDYFPILVMNTVLGGSFTSRLEQNLRETHGYTYGASSRFSMRRAAGPFTARAEVVAAKTDSSLFEFVRELRHIRDTVPVAELEKSKRFLQLQLPNDFETTGDIAGQLVPIVVYGLPLDYYNSYAQRIGAVTQADVQRVAQRYIDPAQLSVVVVGDRKEIEAPLRAAALGDVQVRDLAGRPVQER